jgi:O-antigen/teichoic acid export membrane protein
VTDGAIGALGAGRARRALQALTASYLNAAVSATVRLAVVPFYLRALGPELLGFRTFANETLKYVRLANLGAAPAIAALVAKDLQPGRTLDQLPGTRRLLRAGAQLQQLAAVLGVLVAAAIALVLDRLAADLAPETLGMARICMMVFGFALALQLSSATWVAILAGLQRIASSSSYRMVEALVAAILGVLLVALGWSLYGLAIAAACAALLFLYLVRRRAGRLGIQLAPLRRPLEIEALPGLLGLSGWIVLANASLYLSQHSAYLILGVTPGEGMRSVNSLMLLAAVPAVIHAEFNRIGMVLLPGLTQVHHAEDGRLGSFGIGVLLLRVCGLLSALAFVGLWLCNGAFVSLWVGSEFFAGALDNVLLAAQIALWVWTFGFKTLLEAWFEYERRGVALFIGGVLTVLVSIILVRRIGLPGVLIGALAGEALSVLPFVVVHVARRLAGGGSGLPLLSTVAGVPFLCLVAWIAIGRTVAFRPSSWLELVATATVVAVSFGLCGAVWLRADVRKYGVIDRLRDLLRLSRSES